MGKRTGFFTGDQPVIEVTPTPHAKPAGIDTPLTSGVFYGRSAGDRWPPAGGVGGAVGMIHPHGTSGIEAGGGAATAGFGNYGAQTYKLSLELPKMGIASVSLGLASSKRDGWVKNTLPGAFHPALNDKDTQAARLSANFAFSDDFQADYRFDWTKADQASQHSQLSRTVLPFLTSFVAAGRQEAAAINANTFEKLDSDGIFFLNLISCFPFDFSYRAKRCDIYAMCNGLSTDPVI